MRPLDFEAEKAKQVQRTARRASLRALAEAGGVAPTTRSLYEGVLSRLAREGIDLEDEAIAVYLGGLYEAGRAVESAALVVKAVRWHAPRAIGPDVAAALAGFKRMAVGRGRGQARGLSWNQVDRLVEVIGSPARWRGIADVRRGWRDAALLSVGSDALLRVSEISALDVDDVEDAAVHVRRSKTDQLGLGAACYVGVPTRVRVANWVRTARLDGGALFRAIDRWGHVGARLSAAAVRAIIRRRASEVLGLHGIRGHALRVGSTQELVARQASLVEIQLAGRWVSPTMPSHYGRVQAVGRGAVARLRYDVKGEAG